MATTSFQGEDAKYQSSKETFESSHDIFRTVFPGGFAWEVQAVYSGPPVVVMKYRHWGKMDGAYKGHAPTGEVVETVGIVVAKVTTSRSTQISINQKNSLNPTDNLDLLLLDYNLIISQEPVVHESFGEWIETYTAR